MDEMRKSTTRNKNRRATSRAAALFALLLALSLCTFVSRPAEAGTMQFGNFTPGSGVQIVTPFQQNAGTYQAPDAVALKVDAAAPTVSFSLMVQGAGFAAGTYCELDWDDDHAYGAPRRETNVPLSGGRFSLRQDFTVPVDWLRRLGLQSANGCSVYYKVDVDEEPNDSDRRAPERWLLVRFSLDGSTPVPNPDPAPIPTPTPNPTDPYNPYTPTDPYTPYNPYTPTNPYPSPSPSPNISGLVGPGGGGGCNAFAAAFVLLPMLFVILRSKPKG